MMKIFLRKLFVVVVLTCAVSFSNSFGMQNDPLIKNIKAQIEKSGDAFYEECTHELLSCGKEALKRMPDMKARYKLAFKTYITRFCKDNKIADGVKRAAEDAFSNSIEANEKDIVSLTFHDYGDLSSSD